MPSVDRYLAELVGRLSAELELAVPRSTSELLMAAPTYLELSIEISDGALTQWSIVLDRTSERIELSDGVRPVVASEMLERLVASGRLDFLDGDLTAKTLGMKGNPDFVPTLERGYCRPLPWADGPHQLVSALSVADLVRTGASLLVLGPMGSGKTTLSRALTVEFSATRRSSVAERLPLHLELRNCAPGLRSRLGSADRLTRLEMVETLAEVWNCDAAWRSLAMSELHANNCVIIVDGFDEIGTVLSRSDAARVENALSAELQALALAGSQVIVCSRPTGAPDSLMSDFTPVFIAPMIASEARSFLLRMLSPATSVESIDSMLMRVPSAITTTPLFVGLLGELLRQSVDDVPATRIAVLETGLRELLETRLLRRSNAKSLSDLFRCDYGTLVAVLRSCALDGLRNSHQAGEERFSIAVGDFMEQLRDAEDAADVSAVVRAVARDSGVLWEGSGRLHFSHRVFQEALAAGKLYELSKGDRSHRQLLDSVIGAPESMRTVAELYVEKLLDSTGRVNDVIDLCNSATEQAEGSTRSVRGAVLVWLTAMSLRKLRDRGVGFTRADRFVIDSFRETAGQYVGEVSLLPLQDRVLIAEELGHWGDVRPGVGVKGGLPDIVWVDVAGGRRSLGLSEEVAERLRQSGETRTGRETPSRIATLESFRISKYPVTWAQFECFLTDPHGYRSSESWAWLQPAPDEPTRLERSVRLLDAKRLPNAPAVGVDWFEAMAYAKWLGRRTRAQVSLPTEAEWETAARGDDLRLFPHGDEFDGQLMNWEGSGVGRVVPVGCFDAASTPWEGGPSDLLGNVWEWTTNVAGPVGSDSFAALLTPESSLSTFEDTRRVVRGGCYLNARPLLRCTYRGADLSSSRFDRQGFRVVRHE